MDEDHAHYRGRLWIRPVFGMIFGILFFIIILGIVFNWMNPPAQSYCFFQNGLWSLFGFFVLVWFLSWFFFRPWRRRYWHWHAEDEMEILRRRYARGEITRTQFMTMAKDLEKTRKKNY